MWLPTILSISDLFRRDEIEFVERDDDDYCSTHYALPDFGTADKNGVRMSGDNMKGYFVSLYGAIKDIVFSPVIKSLLQDRVED